MTKTTRTNEIPIDEKDEESLETMTDLDSAETDEESLAITSDAASESESANINHESIQLSLCLMLFMVWILIIYVSLVLAIQNHFTGNTDSVGSETVLMVVSILILISPLVFGVGLARTVTINEQQEDPLRDQVDEKETDEEPSSREFRRTHETV